MKKGKKAYVIKDWTKGEIKEFMGLVDKSDGVGVLDTLRFAHARMYGESDRSYGSCLSMYYKVVASRKKANKRLIDGLVKKIEGQFYEGDTRDENRVSWEELCGVLLSVKDAREIVRLLRGVSI